MHNPLKLSLYFFIGSIVIGAIFPFLFFKIFIFLPPEINDILFFGLPGVVFILLLLTLLYASKVQILRFRIILFVASLIYLGCMFFAIWSLYESLSDATPPNLFPFTDKTAEYKIFKQNNMYMISYNSASNANKHTFCDPWCKDEVVHDATALVGNSPVDLNFLVNKRVTISGSFIYTSEQCIKNNCKPTIGGIGVDIKTIQPL